MKELEQKVLELQATVERLQEQLSRAMATPETAAANAMLAREARRIERQRRAADEVGKSKTVRVRVLKEAEKLVNKRVVKIDASRPVVPSSTWRSRGIWPDAPTVLQPCDDKGEPIIYSVPERVYEALKDELVKV